MKLTYYTIDDLTLPRKKFLRKGWSMKHFDTLEEAIKHYKTLPVQKKKELGLTDGAHVLELVQCVPLFAYDTQGRMCWPAIISSVPCGPRFPRQSWLHRPAFERYI